MLLTFFRQSARLSRLSSLECHETFIPREVRQNEPSLLSSLDYALTHPLAETLVAAICSFNFAFTFLTHREIFFQKFRDLCKLLPSSNVEWCQTRIVCVINVKFKSMSKRSVDNTRDNIMISRVNSLPEGRFARYFLCLDQGHEFRVIGIQETSVHE